MMSETSRLNLPLISPGQAQKEWVHNEALQTLDCLTAASVEEPPRNDPPAAPSDGQSYIIGTTPTGIWAGKAGQIATMTAGGWRYVVPVDGMSAVVKDSALRADYYGGWDIGIVRAARVEIDGDMVLSTRSAAIASASGGTTVDAQARVAIDQILTALRHHGLIAI